MSEAQSIVLPVDLTAAAHRRRAARQGATYATGAVRPIARPPISSEFAEPRRVYLYAKDTILRNGVAAQLRADPTIMLRERSGADPRGVAVIVADDLHADVVAAIGGIRRTCTARIVVVATRLTPTTTTAAFEAGAWFFLRRSDAIAERLVETVRRATDADSPPAGPAEALGDLAGHLDVDEPVLAPWPASLSPRDVEVLRLVAEGRSTASIARDMAYSESTIKSVVHAIVQQLGARNRAHAVALGIRAHVI